MAAANDELQNDAGSAAARVAKRVVVVGAALVHLRRLGDLGELEPAVARAVRVRVRLEARAARHVRGAPHERVTGERAEGAAALAARAAPQQE